MAWLFLAVYQVFFAKMAEMMRYTVFRTGWGYFGLAGCERGLLRTVLPGRDRGKVESLLLANLPAVRYERGFCRPLQELVIAYFEGLGVDFGPDIPVLLDGVGLFTRQVLAACREIKFGQVTSYGLLAAKLGNPCAGRAVGGALGRNRLPLIIPCHRVITSCGQIGGFSAPGGVAIKQKLLSHEDNGQNNRL